MLTFISSVLKPCFKHLTLTKLNSLSKAIACVALGLRVSHLVDVAHLDLHQAQDLLQKLRKHPSCRSLVLVQFKDRFTFLGHKTRFKDYLNQTLQERNELIYIAVDGDEPVKLNEAPMQLMTWLETKLAPFISTKDNVFYSDIIPTCMVSLTGWLLEYPIIYTTHDLGKDDPMDQLDEWEERKNCLGGNQVLQLVQIWLKDHMLLSFSYPAAATLLKEEIVPETKLKYKIDQRLEDVKNAPDWLKQCYCCCEIKRDKIKLDRFAL